MIIFLSTIIKVMGMFQFYSGPAMNLTSLNMIDGATISDCILRCNEQIGHAAMKVVDAGDNGKKIRTMYMEPDGFNFPQETSIYVKEKTHLYT